MRVPNSACCNESVKLAKKYGHPASANYVNAILRRATKGEPDYPSDAIGFLAIYYSYPQWIVEMWVEQYGLEFTKSLLEVGNEVAPITCRVNTLLTSKVQLKRILSDDGIVCSDSKYIDQALVIEPRRVEKLVAYKDGLLTIQGECSMLASLVLNPKPGSFVIDMCAAPGGKATHCGELMNNTGKICGFDIFEHRVKLIIESAKRLKIDIIEASVRDSTILDEGLKEKADYVLIDAPCSGFGIIRKKPDIKYSKDRGQLEQLQTAQRQLLVVGDKYLKKNGFLVYCTCTINKNENENMIKWFLSQNNYSVCDITKDFPWTKTEICETGVILTPNLHGTDGFYICKLQKN